MTPRHWYEFIDGEHDSAGNRVPFETARSALLWIIAMMAFIGLWIVGPLLLFIFGSQQAVVLGFIGVLVPSAGPLVFAALIAAAHAGGDLRHILGEHRRRAHS